MLMIGVGGVVQVLLETNVSGLQDSLLGQEILMITKLATKHVAEISLL